MVPASDKIMSDCDPNSNGHGAGISLPATRLLTVSVIEASGVTATVLTVGPLLRVGQGLVGKM